MTETAHPRESGSSSRHAPWRGAALVLVFGAAFGIRIAHLEDSTIIAERQYRSAVIARAYFFEGNDAVPDWRKEVNAASMRTKPILEPSIFEFAVASIYPFVGGEKLYIPRVLSTLFWLVGGILLFRIAMRIASPCAAILATAYFLFVPLGVHASISFLPDPLMILMFLLSLVAIVRHHERPTRTRLALAALIAGLAILIKPLCVFAILAAFVGLAFTRASVWRRALDRDLLGFLGVSLLIGCSYYGYGFLVAQPADVDAAQLAVGTYPSGLASLGTQARISLVPELWLVREYWQDTLLTAQHVVGLVPLCAALLGLVLLRDTGSRALLLALWVGYALFCLAFTYHVRFSGHYHLQLIVIVALCIAPVIDLLLGRLSKACTSWYSWVPVAAACLLVILFDLRVIHRELGAGKRFEPLAIAREIGEIVGHSTRVLFVAPYYGGPLEYHAELAGLPWPRKKIDLDLRRAARGNSSIEVRLQRLDMIPEYFVVTDFSEFERHHDDMREYLGSRGTLLAQSEHYLIYGLAPE